jgi:glycosyltransferase involved in cell wall biosynthesis
MNNPHKDQTAMILALDRLADPISDSEGLRLTLIDAHSGSDLPDLTANCLLEYTRSQAGRSASSTVFTGQISEKLSVLKRWRLGASLAIRSCRAVKRSDTAVVFVSSPTSAILVLFPALLAGCFYHKRIIARVGGERLLRLTVWRRWFLKSILGRAGRVVTYTDREGMILARLGIKSSVLAPVFPAVTPRPLQPIQPHLIFSLQTWNEVEVAQVIGAHALVKQKYPRATLSVAAPARLHGRIRALAQGERTPIGHAVTLVTPDRRSGLFALGDVCICSYGDSGAPIDLLLSWQYGIPAIAPEFSSAAASIRDGENGLLFKALHRSALADRILEIVENPRLVAELSRSGIAEAGRFTWEAVEPQWRRLLAMQDTA